MSGSCVVAAISGGKVSPSSGQVEKKDSVVSTSEKIAGHQVSSSARGGEIDCFRSFRDEHDERTGCSATFCLDT